MENYQQNDAVELAASERPIIGFFDTKQMRKAKKSSDGNLYQWFHVSKMPTVKQKYVIINYTAESEDDEEIDGKRGTQRQLLNTDIYGYNSAELDQKHKSIEVWHHNSGTETDHVEVVERFPHTSNCQILVGPKLREYEGRRGSPVFKSDGIKSCRSKAAPGLADQTITRSENASELDDGNGSYPYTNQNELNKCFNERKYVPVGTCLSKCDYVCRPSYSKEKGKHFAKMSIYATEKDSRGSPELSVMQEQLHQLVAPTAENLNLAESNQMEPLDPDSTALHQGAGPTNLEAHKYLMPEGSAQISGDDSSGQMHVRQVQQWDGQSKLYLEGSKVLCSALTMEPVENISEQNHTSIPLPEQQSNMTEELESQDILLKNEPKENLPTKVECLENDIDLREKEWARQVTQTSEPNCNPSSKFTISSHPGKPVEAPSETSVEGNMKSYLNSTGTKSGIEVKVLHNEQERDGVSDTKWASCRMKINPKERLEQSYERCWLNREKIPSEQSSLLTKPSIQPSTRTTTEKPSKHAVNDPDSLWNGQKRLNGACNECARKSIVSDHGKRMLSSPVKQHIGKGEKVPHCETGSGETFNGMKKILEKKLDLNYAVMVWKEYYARKQKKQAGVKQKNLQKQTLEQTSNESYRLDIVMADVPEIKPSTLLSGGPTSSVDAVVDSQIVAEYDTDFKTCQDGITFGSGGEADSNCVTYLKALDECGSADKLQQDFSQGKEISKSTETEGSLGPPNRSSPNNKKENHGSSPDSVGSELPLDFYTPLGVASSEAKKYSDNAEAKRIIPAYRHSCEEMPDSVHDNKKLNLDELAQRRYKREQGLKEQGSRVINKIGSKPFRTVEEGLASKILSPGTSRVGRCPHRRHVRSCSKSNRDLDAPGSAREDRRAATQIAEDVLHKDKSKNKSKDISISFRRCRNQASPDFALRSEMKETQRAKECRSSSLTKRSTSRKRNTGLMDFRTSNSDAMDDAKHKIRSSGRCLKGHLK